MALLSPLTSLERELLLLSSKHCGTRCDYLQEVLHQPGHEFLVHAHPFYPKYKYLLKHIPVELTWELLCFFEAHGGFEPLDMFLMTDQGKCKWEQFRYPEEQLQNLFSCWLLKELIARLWFC